jgi:phosphoglucomutase
MMPALAAHYKVNFKMGLTGFKWIAKMIEDYPDEIFLGGGEESFGFMVGDFVRDKDAVTATLLACEVAATAQSKGETFYDQLIHAYEKLGLYQEKLVSFVKNGKEGVAEIKQMMEALRSTPPSTIDGSKVCFVEDYKNGVRCDLNDGTNTPLSLPKSDVILFITADGTRVAARPSGTEPKIKFYFSVNNPHFEKADYEGLQSALLKKIDRICTELGLTS